MGEWANGRHGDTATRRHGESATRRHGDTATRRHGDTATRRHGDTATRRLGDTATRRHGDTATRRHGDTARRPPRVLPRHTSRSNPGLSQTQRARSESCSGALSAFVPHSRNYGGQAGRIHDDGHRSPGLFCCATSWHSATRRGRGYAPSPIRRFAVSPIRPFAQLDPEIFAHEIIQHSRRQKPRDGEFHKMVGYDGVACFRSFRR